MKNSSRKTRRSAADTAVSGVPRSPADTSARPGAARARARPPKDAAEALGRLKAGNGRFVSGKFRHAHEAASWRAHLKNCAASIRDDPGMQ